MSPLPSPLFRDLTPPVGGESRLRMALAQPGSARWPLRWALVPGTALVLAIAWLAPQHADHVPPANQARAALEAALAPPADGFEPRAALLMERRLTPGGVRLYVLTNEQTGQGASRREGSRG